MFFGKLLNNFVKAKGIYQVKQESKKVLVFYKYLYKAR